MLVLVFGFVLVRVGVLRAVIVGVRMLVTGRLRVFVLMIVVRVPVCVRVLHTVRVFVGMLVLFSHAARFVPADTGALPRARTQRTAHVGPSAAMDRERDSVTERGLCR